jgi:periplasmic protein TonB
VSEGLALSRVLSREASHMRAACALAIALLGHGALVALAFDQTAPPPALVAVTEVELAERAAPEPPPKLPEPAASVPDPQPRAERRSAPKRERPAEAPAAKAAALHTIDEDVKTASEPVRFVTDPNGDAFGFGSVARGGTAASATGPVTAAPPIVPEQRSGPGAQPELSRSPALAESDPCRGFFPERAAVDRGEVTLRVRVDGDGSVRAVTVAREAPVGHGFGFAARDCLLSKRFSPALDRAGHPVSVLSPVTVRFAR